MAAAMLSACRFTDFARIPSSTVDFNRSVEAAQNEILLLNILRAAHGQPQYFSEITLVRGSASLSFSSSGSYTSETDRGSTVADDALALTGEMVSRVKNVSPSVGYALSPTFDVSFPRSQEFVNAMMSTIDESSVNAILDLGWEPAQVVALVVEEFYAGDCFRKPGLANFATGSCNAVSYSELEAALPPRIRFEEDIRFNCIGAALDNAKLSDPSVLAELAKASLAIVPGSECDDIAVRSAEAQYLATARSSWTLAVPPSLCGIEGDGTKAAPTERIREGEAGDSDACRLELRTPISLLKFLGEIAADTVNGRNANGYAAILRVQKDSEGDVLTQTDFDGEVFSIPQPGLLSGTTVNSGTTLQIVSLILGLQQSSEALQRTGAVQVIGG